jgi:hypothetical protein
MMIDSARLMVVVTLLGLFHPGVGYAEDASDPRANKPDSAKQGAQLNGEDDREKEAEEARRLTELYLRNQSVFLRKGELMVELNTFYNRNSHSGVVPLDGGVAPVQQKRRFFDTALIARYGILTDGLEISIIAPMYVHSEVESDFGVARVTQKEEGFGDLRGALRYQLWYERGNRPSLIIDAEGKSRTGGTGLTGTGTWNAGGGVTVIKTIDPVVLFGRIGYTHTFGSETRNLGNIMDYRIGMGFSLNDRVSFNIQLTAAHIGPGQIQGFTLAGGAGGAGPIFFSTRRVEMMNIVFTSTVLVTKKLFIEPFIGVGLTEQSFTIIGLRIPYRVL